MQIQQRNRTPLQRTVLSTLALGLVALAALLMPNPARAWQVFKVDPLCNDPSVYSTIQAALNDAALHADGDHFNYVWISNRDTYSGQHIVVNDPATVIIEGGFSDCLDNDPGTDRTVISGAGNGGQPVFDITGYGWLVVLSNLNITGAQTSGDGGGIRFNGWGELDVGQSSIYLNQAGYGAGINFNGSGGNGSLYLLDNTTVLNNTANVSGGGIRVEGSARLYALQPQTWIGYNHANGGYGGGVEILGPARADLGSGGYNGVGVVSYNDAVYGGGIGVVGSGGSGSARIFTTDAAHPVQVSNNTATQTGGGVYLLPNIDNGGARLCAYDFRIDNNIAQEGTAVYADLDSNIAGSQDGGGVMLNYDPYNECAAPESPPALGAVACAPDVACNTMNGNVAENDSNTPTPGSTILVQNNGSLQANRLVMRGNQGAHAIRVIDPQVVADAIGNCLLADNQLTSDLILAQTGDYIHAIGFSNCTMANNVIGSGSVVHSQFSLSLTDSIIDQPGVPTLAYSGNASDLSVAYVLSNDTSTLPVTTGVVQGEPNFVDAGNGDYHLLASSLGVDFAPTAGGSDLDRVSRDVDLTSVPNVYGPRDLGAYERQYACAVDTIFCNGFEL